MFVYFNTHLEYTIHFQEDDPFAIINCKCTFLTIGLAFKTRSDNLIEIGTINKLLKTIQRKLPFFVPKYLENIMSHQISQSQVMLSAWNLFQITPLRSEI